MSSNNTICVIGTYFGQFNNYFSLWLKSCAYNPKIDFYIFGDAEYKGVLPQNVRIEYMTLETVKLRAEKYLGFKVSLVKPYKCCDFKPIYGAIFSDYISSYEYWGHCDFDMIFGDVFSFLEKNNYQAYDRFFNLGHLSFYRNDQKVFNYLKLEGSLVDYRTVFTTPKNFAFDEVGLNQIYIKNKLPFFTKRLFADISEPERHYRFKHSQYCYINEPPFENFKYQIFYWEKGKVFCAFFNGDKFSSQEFSYIHFKHRPNFRVEFDFNKINSFYITPIGFVEREQEILTKELVQKLNPITHIPFYECFEFLKWKLKGRFETILNFSKKM